MWMDISIHSPHTRGDVTALQRRMNEFQISIHSPHTRGDFQGLVPFLRIPHFNPLPSHEGRH